MPKPTRKAGPLMGVNISDGVSARSEVMPTWWPHVVAAAEKRRNVTGRLLAHATPHVTHGRLHLRFARPDLAVAWQSSGAQAALEGALAHYGWSMPVIVAD